MPDALQVCPNDHPPFLAICQDFQAVLTKLGYRAETIFFESRIGASGGPHRHYAPPRDVPGYAPRGKVDLILTHRYKGYRAALAVPSDLQVSVAHDVGMFRRSRRRWRQRFSSMRVVFAGVSTHVAEDLAGDLGRSCEILPNPTDPEAAHASLLTREEARRALQLDPSHYLIGVVGRLHRMKNPLLAVAGFQRAARELGSDAELVFVGYGDMESLIPRAGNIRLTGFVANASRYLRAFDVILSTTTPREPFGMIFLEAMVAGIPVVCTDQRGPREVMGEYARFVPDRDPDAVARALVASRRETGSPHADCGYQRVVANFSIDAVAARLERIIAAAK